ncbi:iron ABC transporter permease [Caldibacillus lycopersici]|uniref:Iron ABC transporter permease n=1 Tax=Perspicuibacillus lycopersici TaxID=1325689 RepID=A0AAE3IVK3_9BACI|nr:iron ABC transporter permease [Perspicuibacillus lycopersici]MCU9615017.1 iron ABC transporter permease [Perspicuibacillus lycopersici]
MREYKSKNVIKWLAILLVLFIVVFVAGISIGSGSLTVDRIIPTLLGYGSFKEDFILFTVRLPRILILALAGMALAVSGTILQSVTRNDLAEPGIIGINAGAGVGITIFYLFAKADIMNFAYVMPLVGFAGALATASCIYLFSYEKGKGIHPVRLVLVGVGFAFALSGVMMILISSAERSEVDFIAQWLAGNVWGTDWPFIFAFLPWIIILFPIVFFKANVLNLLALNEPTAIGLGIHLKQERLKLLCIAVALAAAAVSVTGGIAFIGLMTPHIAKRLVGPRHQFFLPIATLTGATLLMFADTIGRSVLETATIPAGIVVALIGAPYFLYLLKSVI